MATAERTRAPGPPHGGTGLALVDLVESRSVPIAAFAGVVSLAFFVVGFFIADLSEWLPDSSVLSLAFWRHVRGWFDAVMAAAIGYALAATALTVRGSRRDWSALAASLAGSPEERARGERSLFDFGGGLKHAVSILAVATGLTVNALPLNWPDGRPAYTDAFFLWTSLRTSFLFWAVTRFVYVDLTLAARFSGLGRFVERVDLLELGPFAVFGRHGLRSVLLLMGLSALFALMTLAPWGRSTSGAAIVATLAVGCLAFFAPVRGAHRRRQEERDAALAKVRAAIHVRVAEPDAARPPEPTRSLADLLAWEARLERVATWPFDAGTLVRFALYVAIGGGSWLGGALVERALGLALD